MEVYIPSFRYEESDLERGYTVGAGRGGTGPREPGLRLLSPEGSSGSRRPCAGLRGGVPSLPSLSLPSPGPLGRLRPGVVVKETGAPSLARRRRRRALGVPRFGPFPLPARLPAFG